MNITFIVPMLNLTGGLRVVAIYADLLAKNGHTVTVISPAGKEPSFVQKVKSSLRWKGYSFDSGFDDSFFCNSACNIKILDKYRPINNEDVPDADIVIATFWNTVEWVATYDSKKGKKVYFIQHYEVHPWLNVERVKATYKLPFKKIVVAQWIADTLVNEYQQGNISVITNAVDHQLFYAPARVKNSKVYFGMMYSARKYKGSELAFNSFRQLKIQYPSINLVVFGLEPLVSVVGLPNNEKYISKPNQNELRHIYSQCDAWLFTSNSEGFGLPILEAMACRTPVIGTRCGAAPDLLESGGGMLVDVDDSGGLISAMTKLYEMDGDAWKLMSDRAYNEALSHQWEDKVIQFENALSCN